MQKLNIKIKRLEKTNTIREKTINQYSIYVEFSLDTAEKGTLKC